MQRLIGILLLLLGVQSYAQSGNFTQKLFSCHFNESDRQYWPVKNNSGFNFTIEDNHYKIECLDENKKSFAPLKWEFKEGTYKVETNFRLEKGTDGTVGLAFDIQGKFEGGYVLQLDNNRKYRLVSIEGGSLKSITGDKKNNGWLEFKKLNKPGKDNKVAISQKDGKVDIILNEEEVFSLPNKLKNHFGGFGFMLDGRSGAIVEDFTIFGIGPPVVDSILLKATLAQEKARKDSIFKANKKVKPTAVAEKKNVPDKTEPKTAVKPTPKPAESTQAIEKKDTRDKLVKAPTQAEKKPTKPIEPNEPKQAATDSTKDLSTLGIAIGECRKKSLQLQTENANMSAELKQIKNKNEELQAFINKNLDIKLKTELEVQKNKNEILAKENDKLKVANYDLTKLKENIEKARDGDIIIVLSDNLKKEQKKNEDLLKKIKEMEDKAKAKPVPAPKPKPEDKKTEPKPVQKPEVKPTPVPVIPPKPPVKTK